MKANERRFIIEGLHARQDHETIARNLCLLAMSDAVKDVEKVAQEMHIARSRNAKIQARQFVTLRGPQPQPVKAKDSDGMSAEQWEMPKPQEYRVLVSDLPAFAKEHKINLSQLQEVVAGKRKDASGHTAAWSGSTYDQTVNYVDMEAEIRRRAERAKVEAQRQAHPLRSWITSLSKPLMRSPPSSSSALPHAPSRLISRLGAAFFLPWGGARSRLRQTGRRAAWTSGSTWPPELLTTISKTR